MSSFSRVSAAAIAIGVFAVDRYSKWVVETQFSPDTVKSVIPGFFNIVRSENPGVAFSLFADDTWKWHTPALVILSIAAISILAGMLWKIDRLDRMSAVGLSLIFGGAIGNVYDRVHAGVVTDFLDFYIRSYHWYVFNLADSAICVGAGLLLLSMFTGNEKAKDQKEASA